MSLDTAQVAAYLTRLGIADTPVPSAQSLAALQRAHLLHVPFENLDIHLGRPLSLELGDLYAKVVERGHGGFCYELNGLFAELLEALGFRVVRMAARVVNRETGELGPPFDHLCLRVLLAEPRLCDVGFGRGFLTPLRLVDTSWQSDGREEFRILAGAPEWTLESRERPLYAFDPRPRVLADFAEMCRYHQSSPQSPFPRARMWTIATERGRETLRGETCVSELDGVITERPATEADWERCRAQA